MKAQYWCLANRPAGIPTTDCFELAEQELPALEENQVLVEIDVFSTDPGMRSRLGGDSYAAALGIGEKIESAAIGRIIESTSPRYQAGDMVMGGFGWCSGVVQNDRGLQKLDPALFDDTLPLSAAIGVLGIPGLTAYFGLKDLGKPEAGKTLLVSSAAGTVGATAGQLGKLWGLNVVGIAGGGEKCDYIRQCGFHAAIDYKNEDLSAAIKQHCPKGVDIYFDNVGGEMLDIAISHMRPFGHIIISGAISEYNAPTPRGIRNILPFITHRLSMAGLVVYDYRKDFPTAQKELAAYIKAGKLRFKEDISTGIDQAPDAFLSLFDGRSFGRRLIKLQK